MKWLPKFLKEFVGRPGDAKRHEDGIEFPDPKVIEVPVKLLQRHQDIQQYIRAYVQSEVKLAELQGEHETLEDALDMEIDDPHFAAEVTAAQLEAEELDQMANDSFELRRIKKMVDLDREMKARSAAAPPAKPDGTAPVEGATS